MRDTAARPIEQIRTEVAATNMRLAQLEIELAEAIDVRRQAVIKAFDDGASRAQIVAAFPPITYQVVANILHKAGRSEKQRATLGLTPKQEAEFQRLTRAGVSVRAARSIAETIASRMPASHAGQKAGAP